MNCVELIFETQEMIAAREDGVLFTFVSDEVHVFVLCAANESSFTQLLPLAVVNHNFLARLDFRHFLKLTRPQIIVIGAFEGAFWNLRRGAEEKEAIPLLA